MTATKAPTATTTSEDAVREGRLPTLAEILAHARIRRNVWFCRYYRSKVKREMPAGGWWNDAQMSSIWSALAELDNFLEDCARIGLVPEGWRANVPYSRTDNGGFDQQMLIDELEPADVPPVPVPGAGALHIPVDESERKG